MTDQARLDRLESRLEALEVKLRDIEHDYIPKGELTPLYHRLNDAFAALADHLKIPEFLIWSRRRS
tara:strand:- start:104 stop:301 length:198 start_codon:yes stop_codon:yes gene_type:complete